LENNFQLYSKYYDLLYQKKDYPAEAAYINSLIKNYHPSAKSIIELGSGTGKHAYLLAEYGYRVLGIERSEEMLNIAKQGKAEEVSFQIGDITNFELHETFDVAISLFHVISYVTDSKNLVQTFKNIHHHLKTGGILIFDVWHSSAVHSQTPEKRTKLLADQDFSVTRNAIPTIYPEQNIVEVNYEIEVKDLKQLTTHKFDEKHPMRHFSRPELEILAQAAQFEILHSEEFLTKNTPSANTWGVNYILRKI
jgi:SAM-dependent methyltransferase